MRAVVEIKPKGGIKKMNSKRTALGTALAVVVLALAVMTAPAMARMDDATFYLNASDSSHSITVEPEEEVTIYLNVYAPVNKTSCVTAAVVFDPEVVECRGVTENASTNWYFWEYMGVNPATDDRDYFWFKTWDPAMGMGPGHIDCGDITLKGLSPGITIMYLGMYPEDIPGAENETLLGDMGGYGKDWTLSEPFTVICGSPETFTTSPDLGWNLISLPLIPVNDSTSAVLGNDDCTIVYNNVYSYDASTNQFVDVTDGTMETGVGYFVDVTTEGTWSYDGIAYESMSASLSQGLNCVGWTNTSADIPGGALASIAGDYRYVARWNTVEQEYELYDPVGAGEGPEFIDFTTMERGVGYFIAATTGCTLTYP
jgi:hypothetical protein